MSFFKLIGITVFVLFYGSYVVKMLLQKRKGIFTDRMAKGQKEKQTANFEIYLKIITYSLAGAQIASIFFYKDNDFGLLQSIGFAVAIFGIAIFITAMATMSDSWRAGVDISQKTKIITSGVYKYSRNPAFVGFDLFYIGLVIAYPNLILTIITILAVIMLHFQILQEEKYLPAMFGDDYINYKKATPRYFLFI